MGLISNGGIVSGLIASGNISRNHLASGSVGSGAFAAVSAVGDIAAATGGVVGYLDAAERNAVRTTVNNILLALKNAGIMVSG